MNLTQAEKAARARLKQACAHSSEVDLLLTEIKHGADMEAKMPKLRILYASLGQAIHEFNAYYNVVTTGK